MSTMEAVVIIVALVSFARVLRVRMQAEARLDHPGGFAPRLDADGHPLAFADPGADDVRRDNETLRRDLAALAERVKVLERIVTDNRRSGDLAAEIESLRDR